MSADRITEILTKLNELHNGGGGEVFDPNSEAYAQLQCDMMNETAGKLNEYDGYSCRKCNNKGYIYIIQQNPFNGAFLPVQKDCKCRKIRDTLERAKNSGLGDTLTANTFDKYETFDEWQQQIKQAAQDFCNDEGAKWFYIGGQTGAGKSHICTAIAAHYIKAGYDCRYMLWRDDAVKLKSVTNDFETYQRLINDFKKVDVLYIDDFLKTKDGAEPTTADFNLAFELLNFRLQDNKKITIISSEFVINKLLEYDEATAGRIYQLTGNYKINIDRDIAKNYRLRNKKGV